MGPFDAHLRGTNFKPLPPKKPSIVKVVKSSSSNTTPRPSPKPDSSSVASSSTLVNGKANSVNGHARGLSRSLTPSQPTSKEPKDPVKQVRSSNLKRSSPAVSTPRFSDSDDNEEEEEEDLRTTKRPKLDRNASLDTKRRIRDVKSFSEDDQGTFTMVHAKNIANLGTDEKPDPKYNTFFTALQENEDEAPTVELQYPSASQRERYQLVRSKDGEDFQPLDEIIQVIKTVAENFLKSDQALAFNDEASGGLAQRLERARKRGFKGVAGAQGQFIAALTEYNKTVTALQKDGSLAKHLDGLHTLDISFVETLLRQIYARTVSPQVTLLKAYENGTDNVYGELLPRFVSRIFKETHLKSHHVFVDLGSGVGNVALQAALQIGCESWGCEMMNNAAELANLQKKEFPARCRLWGIQPGAVYLQHGDFLKDRPTLEALRRADLVLINNQAFTPKLNADLILLFYELKESCQIVSLKSFVPHGHRIQASNVNDPINMLEVQEKVYYSNSVSWTDAAGNWYLQRKDRRRLDRFLKTMNGRA